MPAPYLLIYNPVSGRRQHHSMMQWVIDWFRKKNLSLVIAETQYSGHAEELVHKALSEGPWSAIIAAGGDGTVNEVINGLLGSDVPLGILAWGTTNVFCLEMGFPSSLQLQCQQILQGKTLRFDIGRANGRAFLMMVGIGFDAFALRQVSSLKRHIGPLAYVLAAFKALFQFNHPILCYSTKGQKLRKAAFMVISNTKRYGGVFTFSPQANPFDGKLDMYTYRERGHFRLLKLGFSLIASLVHQSRRNRRRFFYMRESHIPVQDIIIESDKTAYFQIDGDFAGTLPLHISLETAAINIIVP